MTDDAKPATPGIYGGPVWNTPLAVLEYADRECQRTPLEEVRAAAREVSIYQPPSDDQAFRHAALSVALETFLTALVQNCPPGPERSAAISRARDAKMWASAAIALEQ